MSTTELDDLKTAWQTLNRNLERQNTLTFHQFKEGKMARLRSGLRSLVIGQTIQIICGVLIVVLSARFWANHLGFARPMIYGISLHAYGVIMIIFAAREFFLIHRLDYAAPVIDLQKRIAELRKWHLNAAIWFGVTGCIIWIPLVLAIFYGLGADVWAHNPEVVGWLVLSGLVCIAVFLGIVLWSRRSGKEKLARGLEDSSVGRSLNRAQAVLDDIARFEGE
ncbi:MAG: hypothetical protein ABI925_01655 [Verrucomicrobiota bacterium]